MEVGWLILWRSRWVYFYFTKTQSISSSYQATPSSSGMDHAALLKTHISHRWHTRHQALEPLLRFRKIKTKSSSTRQGELAVDSNAKERELSQHLMVLKSTRFNWIIRRTNFLSRSLIQTSLVFIVMSQNSFSSLWWNLRSMSKVSFHWQISQLKRFKVLTHLWFLSMPRTT